jgi:hypothetical protein
MPLACQRPHFAVVSKSAWGNRCSATPLTYVHGWRRRGFCSIRKSLFIYQRINVKMKWKWDKGTDKVKELTQIRLPTTCSITTEFVTPRTCHELNLHLSRWITRSESQTLAKRCGKSVSAVIYIRLSVNQQARSPINFLSCLIYIPADTF